ncbi:cytochrome C oxidase subunit IV family protein [Thiohalobacter sp. IOR34]|uniref:cytochrome C oxidase subunit IV family protein n=1 Tax=Thiohalobacter sp. IOR34 TaxID=3057176 RepID=UPI0025B04EAD|nr:cytochrome C oxidase subunit IV family protein [Thiohalobacter sp. IOR34]WJW75444.1 cytochrome C oxidase subunit IV family protein [Thiohalobacter sp. IOR34]
MKSTRRSALLRPCTWTWLLLLGLTWITYMIGQAGLSGLHVSLLVLGFALLKGQLVGDYFMGLKRVRSPWRWAITLWLLIPGSLITTAFVLATGGR